MAPGGLVAVGDSAPDLTAATGLTLISADGLTWTQGAAADGSFSDGFPTDVWAQPAGYVALGYAPDPDDFSLQRVRLWRSPDGQAWHAIGQASATYNQFGAAALGQSGLVAFAATQDEVSNELNSASVFSAWFVPIAALAQ